MNLLKEQLFKPELYNSKEIAGTRWTLYTVGRQILQLYAPFLPYVTETVYQELYKPHDKTLSLHITHFDSRKFIFEKSNEITCKLVALVTQVRSLKTEQQLSLKAPLQSLEVYCNDQAFLDALRSLEQIIKGITHAITINYFKGNIEQSQLVGNNEAWIVKITI